MNNSSNIIPTVEEAMSNNPVTIIEYSVTLDACAGWMLNRSNSSVSLAISQADALRIINHIALFNNGEPAFCAITR